VFFKQNQFFSIYFCGEATLPSVPSRFIIQYFVKHIFTNNIYK